MTIYPRYETVSFLRAAGASYIEGLVLMRYAQKAVEDSTLAAHERVVHVEVWGEETCGISYHHGHPVDLTVEHQAIYWYRVTIHGEPPAAAVLAGDPGEGVDQVLVEGSAAS
ncbi:hypothetical protein IWX63_000518 [Arthrobacter sp. CAN_A2]|uniref:hypothetical protein n=1 Tax=Arthrobacter sp. CAN_A2 TaxID=2787718 RepID=UPI0018EFFBFB